MDPHKKLSDGFAICTLSVIGIFFIALGAILLSVMGDAQTALPSDLMEHICVPAGDKVVVWSGLDVYYTVASDTAIRKTHVNGAFGGASLLFFTDVFYNSSIVWPCYTANGARLDDIFFMPPGYVYYQATIHLAAGVLSLVIGVACFVVAIATLVSLFKRRRIIGVSYLEIPTM